MLNEVVLVKPSYFKETGNKVVTDKNGKPTVILSPVAGKIPNTAMVISGSVAQSAGILNSDDSIAGELQLVLVNEIEPSAEYGRQFSVMLLDSNVSGKEVVNYRRDLGAAFLIPTDNNVTNNSENVSSATPTLNTSKASGAVSQKTAAVTE